MTLVPQGDSWFINTATGSTQRIEEEDMLCTLCGFGAHRHFITYYDGWGTVMCTHEQVSDLSFKMVRKVLARMRNIE